MDFMCRVVQSMPHDEVLPNFIIEGGYDIILELVRARLLSDGFNSSSSHEAEVSYLRVIGFPESDARFMDELRFARNGIQYYGKSFDWEYADQVRKFLNRNYDLLKDGVIRKG